MWFQFEMWPFLNHQVPLDPSVIHVLPTKTYLKGEWLAWLQGAGDTTI